MLSFVGTQPIKGPDTLKSDLVGILGVKERVFKKPEMLVSQFK